MRRSKNRTRAGSLYRAIELLKPTNERGKTMNRLDVTEDRRRQD
jgi:hypothetical protein